MLRIKVDEVASVDISGKGGAEAKIFPLFENRLKRKDQPLYDAVDEDTQTTYEVKKQKNLQWFDVGKYYGLTPREQHIVMIFIVYDDAGISLIFTQKLGDFVGTCCADAECAKDGWTEENIADAAAKKKEYPAMQYKVPLKIKTYFAKYTNQVEVIYSR
tara:strand:+ start:600 stop:1076 length:477 start_codon:yes stop_codon:yes gene_type:complete